MEFVRFGGAGVKVSRLALGLGLRGQADEREAERLILSAFERGINLFDCANVYGLMDDRAYAGRSEEIMGATLLKTVKREEVVISTKVGIRMSPAQNDQGTGRKHLMAAVDEQLKRLQTDYIDVYQVHRLDPYTPMEETMYSLDQIVRSGKVRYIGGSTMPAYKFAQMIMIADGKGYARPIAMQNLYNMIQREEEREMNRLCEEQGVGLIPYSPLAQGYLTGKYDHGARPQGSRSQLFNRGQRYETPNAAEGLLEYNELARSFGMEPALFANAYVSSRPFVTSNIVGATSVAQLETALSSSEVIWTEQMQNAVDAIHQRVGNPCP